MTAPTTQAGTTLTATQIAELIALVKSQAKTRQQLTEFAVAAAAAPFRALSPDDWWNAKKVEGAIRAALRVVQPNQRIAARVTDAYLARAVSVMTGRRVRPAGAVDVTKLRHIIPTATARRLADGALHPGYLVLGEHDPQHRRVVPTEQIDAPLHLVVPEPGESAARRIRRLRTGEGAAKPMDPAEPYGRVADALRYQIVADGLPAQKAIDKALVRIGAVAQTDVTLAVREQVRKSLMPIKDVRGYRRILHPELTLSGPCGLCVVAADRVYRTEDLHPIHSACVCEVLPIIGGLDPGLRLNSDDLEAIYNAAGGTGGEVIKDGRHHSAALKRVRVALVEHGELGPYLVDADQTFRGPREVAKTQVPDKATRFRAQLASLEERFAVLERKRAAGEDVAAPMRWQADRIAFLRRELDHAQRSVDAGLTDHRA